MERWASARFPWVPALAGSRFVLNVIGTVAARGAILLLGLGTTVLVARALGPAGRGDYAVALAVSAIGVQLANLGLHTSSSWAVAQRPHLVGPLLANDLVASAGVGGAAIAVGLAAFAVFPAARPLALPVMVLALVAIPLGLFYLNEQNLLLGLQRVRAYNVLEIANRSCLLVLLVALLAERALGVVSAVAAVAVVLIGVAAVGFALLWRGSAEPVRPRLGLVHAYGRYGLRAYVAALLTYLVLRVDLLMVQELRGAADAGQYSIAVALAELLLVVPGLIATIMFPTLSRMTDPERRWRTAARITGVVGLFGVVFVPVIALLGEPLIRLLYGTPYLPALPSFEWLLPGIGLLAVATVVMHYFYAVGVPAVAIYAPLAGVAVNIAMNFVLIPAAGIVGASISSTVAYGLMLIVCGVQFIRLRRAPA